MIGVRWIGAAAAVASVILLAAACGGGSGSSTTSAAATQAATTATPATQAASTDAAATNEAAGTLVGTVGPGFTITLTQDGQAVTSLAAGSYDITIDDKASIHNFHLMGPGVDEATDVSGTGMTTWHVTLAPGEYTFQCDPHASTMNGSFTVS